MAIKVNTTLVATTAATIASRNRKIKSEFGKLETDITQMNNNWDGSGADAAVRGFRKIKKSFADNRYAVVNDFVRFLNSQVVEGYTNTESAVSSAAKAFK